MRAKLIVLSILLLLLTIPNLAAAAGAGMHYFDCKECHLSGLSISALQGGGEAGSNLCLKCHNDTLGGETPLNPGNEQNYYNAVKSDGLFVSGDASNHYNTFRRGSGQVARDRETPRRYTGGIGTRWH